MKRVNLNNVLWFMILGGLYIYMCYLLSTGRLRYFVHPRMFKYIELSLFAIAILALNQFFKVFKRSRAVKIKKGYALFLIPLLLGFVISPRGLNESIAEKKGFAPQQSELSITGNPDKKNLIFDYFNYGTVTFNNYEYVTIMNDVSRNYNKYNGKNVIIEGFVYRAKGFPKNEFVTARLLMTCCAADTSVVGLKGNWDKAYTLKRGDWIRLEGKIRYVSKYDEISKKNSVAPSVEVDRVVKIDKPDIEYVYP